MTADPPTPAEDNGDGELLPRPWERRAVGESAAAFAAFCRYRDLGPRRSLDEVDRQLYPPPAPGQRRTSASRRRRGQISDWSRAHDWVTRAAAWDAHLDCEARLAHVEAVREMGVRHAQVARALQERALAALESLSPADLAAHEILRFLVESARLERLALGEPTDRTSQEVSGGAPVVVEVVERIVPVRGDDRPIQSPTSVRLFEGVAGGPVPDAGASGGQEDPAHFELPPDPPEFMRPTGR